AVGGGASGPPVGGEPPAYLADGVGEREDVGAHEQVEVLGTDRVPVHAVGGDGDLGQQGLGGEDHPVGGRAALRDRADDLVVAGDAPCVQPGVQRVLVGGV